MNWTPEPDGEIQEDDVPGPPEETVTKPGDLWILGRHRLLCGDCRFPENVDRLFKGAKVDSIVTDPPYGVDYGEKNAILNSLDGGNRVQTPIIRSIYSCPARSCTRCVWPSKIEGSRGAITSYG